MRRVPLLAVPVALAAAGPAAACTVIAPTPGTPIVSDLAVAGTVVSGTEHSRTSPSDPVTYTFRVDTVLRGRAGDTVQVQTSGSGATCGVAFSVGTRYLLFASVYDQDGGFFPKGALVTGIGSGDRPLGAAERVGTEDLYWPPPFGFDTKGSDLTPRQLVEFSGYPVYWAGGYNLGGLRAIHRTRLGVTVVYGDRRHRVNVSTRPICFARVGAEVPRLTGRRTIRGVPAGFRRGGLSLFTAGVEVRITGGSGATKLRTAQLIGRSHLTAAERRTVTARLPEPILRPVSRLVPCATR